MTDRREVAIEYNAGLRPATIALAGLASKFRI
jgi:hypothetical protein